MIVGDHEGTHSMLMGEHPVISDHVKSRRQRACGGALWQKLHLRPGTGELHAGTNTAIGREQKTTFKISAGRKRLELVAHDTG